MQKAIRIDILRRAHHLNQPLLGFHRWAKANGYALEIRDCSQSDEYKIKKTALVVYFDRQCLIYDMADGYQSPDAEAYLLSLSDYYFKRSFSEEKNRERNYNGIYPYGLNYDVTWAGNPLSKKRKFGVFRTAWESVVGTLLTPEKIENQPNGSKERTPRILFMARLWPEESKLTKIENEERREINETRIEILRRVKENFPQQAVIGLQGIKATKEMAPELITPWMRTRKNSYLELMKQSDICIATTGLHGSIGWKFGEYVAASRAIVSEKLHYTVPGNFAAGKNYLEFETADQCIEQIQFLIDHPEMILSMQKKNWEYYQEYMKPEMLIQNTLSIAGVGEFAQ